MALFDTTRPRAAGHHSLRSAGLFGQLVGMVASWNDTRVTRDALTRLSDHELDDLGLSRGDIDALSRRTRY